MEKEFYTYQEAVDELGIQRSTLYTMMIDLGIKPHKFKYDRKRYIAAPDIQRIKEVREKPWKAGPDDGKDEAKSENASKEVA